MISRIRGKIIQRNETDVLVDVNGIVYQVNLPKTAAARIAADDSGCIDLVIYHYFSIDGNRGIPVLIGFADEFERDFFEQFISVSGIGPRAALRAFEKPVSHIARAIEDGDMAFLRTLGGIGPQKAKQIIASLQGKVGRFALLKPHESRETVGKKEVVDEARQILKRLQYNARESEEMMAKALKVRPDVDNVGDLLNEIYRQQK